MTGPKSLYSVHKRHFNLPRSLTQLFHFIGDPDEDKEESKLWTELSSERVLRAVEAALAALHILTAENMPKRAYLEDVIERIVQLARFQL